MAANQTGLKKRQEIASTNRMMFLWVAGASVIIGAAIVVGAFLVAKIMFTEKVVESKQATEATISKNLTTIDSLKAQIRVLNVNDALKSTMVQGESDPVQVVLDALPSDANSTALGASLQQKFFNLPGLAVRSLVVNPPEGTSAPSTGGAAASSADATTTNTSVSSNVITFSFTVSANPGTIETLLQNIEKSIRTIDLTNISLNYQGNTLLLTATGQAYYQPPTTTQLGSETVKP